MTQKPIIIGTRSSKLALWQSNWVQSQLSDHGIESEIKTIESQGDKDRISPLHHIGGNGLFTKTLDDALLNEQIDIAVHSLKDYPTQMHEGIVMGAHLTREDPRDILILHPSKTHLESEKDIRLLATGSVRRTASWLNKFPETEIVGLRGNVPTRLSKLAESNWDGIILAYAGVLRLSIENVHAIPLEWMIPAPAQGIVGVTCRSGDNDLISKLEQINDKKAMQCAFAERTFMSAMESGCSVPIGALAKIHQDTLSMKAFIAKPNGDVSFTMRFQADLKDHKVKLHEWVQYLKKEVIRDQWWNG